jgi:hypothetical protein
MGLILFFPADQGIQRAKNYAHDFFINGTLNGLSFYGNLPQERYAKVQQLVIDMPQMLDLNGFFNNHPTIAYKERPAIEAALQTQRTKALQGIRQLLPLLKDETLLHEDIQILRQPWNGLQAGSLVYRRETTKGALAVASPHTKVDVNGQVQDVNWVYSPNFAVQPQSTLASARDAVTEDAVAEDVVETLVGVGSTLGQFLGFGIAATGNPIAGMVLAAGAAVFGQLFTAFTADSKTSLADSISSLLTGDLVQYDIDDKVSKIDSYYRWYVVRYDGAWEGGDDVGDPNDPQSDYNKFKQYLDQACDDVSDLVQAIDKLMTGTFGGDDPSYQMIALQPFLVGANLHCTLYKTALLLDVHSTTKFSSPYLDHLVSYLEMYVEHASNVVTQIETKINARLRKISALQRGAMAIPSFSHAMPPPCHQGFLVTDAGADSSFFNSILGIPSNTVIFVEDTQSGCGYCPTFTQHQADAQKQLDSYSATIRSQMEQKYIYTKKDDIKSTIATMKANLDKYKNWQQFAKANPSATIPTK